MKLINDVRVLSNKGIVIEPLTSEFVYTSHPTRQLIDLTPELARQFLTLNTNNRKIKAETIKQYVAAIIKGEWMENPGAAILFDPTGKMIDGQHRCTAVDQTGITIPTYVCTGVNPKLFAVLDSCKNRSGGDTLSVLRGHIPYNTLMSTILRIMNDITTRNGHFDTNVKTSQVLLTNIYDNYKTELESALAHYNDNNKRYDKYFRRASAVAMYTILGLVNAEKRDEFFYHMHELRTTKPLFIKLRDTLEDLKERCSQIKGINTKDRDKFETAIIITAWNKFMTGQINSKANITWNDNSYTRLYPEQPTPDTYPRINGYNYQL